MSEEPPDAVRCAEWARQQRVELGGTAASCDGYLLVEWPPPWPRDASLVEELAPMLPALSSLRTRLQLVRSDRPTFDACRIIRYWRDPATAFRRYARTEAVAPLASVPNVASDLLSAAPPAEANASARRPRDLLICGHGSRDACCGSGGTQLQRIMRESSVVRDSGVRVWRTTHLGGHRFAPTAVSLPDGLVWGRLDGPALEVIMEKREPSSLVTEHLRGCSGLQTPHGQLLDRVLLAEYGWSWLDGFRTSDRDGDRVRLTAEVPGQDARTWMAVVHETRELPIPICRAPLGDSDKVESELVLAAYRLDE